MKSMKLDLSQATRLRRSLLTTALLVALVPLLGACAEEDTQAPPPPRFDLMTSPTGDATIVLAGTAEYGSTITLVREPVFTAEETTQYGPFTVEADPFTAAWWLVVPLAEGVDNVFTATAADRRGNVSDPSSVTIAQVPPTWTEVYVAVEPTRVLAGEVAVVTVTGVDNYGATRVIEDAALASSGDDATFDGSRVTHTVAGTKVITATAAGVSADVELIVSPAPASSIVLTLDAADLDGMTEGLQVTPDTDIALAWVVTDAFGNELDAGVNVATNAPGFVREGALTGVTLAGTYDVVATVLGTGVSDAESFDVIPGEAAAIDLELSSNAVVAGETIAFATTVYDAWGNLAASETVELTTDAPAGGVTLDATGGTVTFTAAGSFEFTATALSDDTVTSTATVSVRPGPVTVVDLTLDPTPAVVAPGTTVRYAVTATDQFGNLSSEVIRILTNAPGAIVAAGELNNLTLAGTYTVWAEASGTGVSDAETLTVTPGTAAAVDLVLTRPTQPTGLPMKYFVTVVDAWGNNVTGGLTISTTDGAAVIDELAGTIVFATPGIHTVTADYNGLTDTESVMVYLEPDVGPPSVEVVQPQPTDIFAPGEFVTVLVQATDDRSLSQVRLQIRGAFRYDDFILVPSGITNYTATFVVRVPNGADYGAAFLTPAAYDEAGNIMVGVRTSFQVNPTGDLVVPTGTANFIAGGPNTRLNSPRGIDHDDTGLVYVANNGNQNVVTVDLATGTIAQFGVGTGQGPWDVAAIPGGGVFVAVGNRVVHMDAAGASTDPWSANNNGWLHNVELDPTNNELYVTDNNNDVIRRYDAAGAPTVTADWTADPGGLLNGPSGLAAARASNNDELVYVANDGSDRIIEYNRTQGTERTLVQGNAIDVPQGLILLPTGDLLVANDNSGTLVKVALSACAMTPCTTTVVASGFSRPVGLSLDPASTVSQATVVVSDRNWDALVEVTFIP